MATQVKDKSDASARPKKERVKPTAPVRVTPRRPGPFQKMGRYLMEVRHELSRTQWPSREEWFKATQVVFGLLVAVGLYIFLMDVGIGWVLRVLRVSD